MKVTIEIEDSEDKTEILTSLVLPNEPELEATLATYTALFLIEFLYSEEFQNKFEQFLNKLEVKNASEE